MELINYCDNQLILDAEVSSKLRTLYAAKAEFDVTIDAVKNAMLEVMEEHSIKSFENDFLKITYKAPSARKLVDTNALKEQGLYESYVKESPVKSSVVVSFK